MTPQAEHCVRRVELATLNGEPGFVLMVDDAVYLAGTIEVADGRVSAVRWVLNPDKLHWVRAPT